MAWTTPVTQSTGYLVPATVYNAQLIDNLLLLKTSISDDGLTWSGTVTGTVTGTVAGANLVVPRVTAVTSSATPTPDVATTDIYSLTALAASATFGIPAEGPIDGQILVIRVADNGTSQGLAWNAVYQGNLPAATVVGKVTQIEFLYDAGASAWVGGPASTAGSLNVLPVDTFATLPGTAVAGSIALLSDTNRGPWLHNGTQWYASDGMIFEARAFGAVGNGVADDTAALQAAIAAANNSAKGGVVRLEAQHVYNCASGLVLDGMQGVTIDGQGATLSFSGTATPFISMKSCAWITWRKVFFTYTSSSFTGDLVATGSTGSDPGYLTWEDCWFGGTSSVYSAAILLSLNNAIICSVVRCRFFYGVIGIQGTGTEYSNSVTIQGCTFVDLGTVCIYNAGQAWQILNCTFEPLANGNAAAYDMVTTGYAWGLSFIGNWFGDASSGASVGTWINHVVALGFLASGNYFGTAGATNVNVAIRIEGSQGVTVTGNRFDGFALDFASSTSHGVFVSGNDFGGGSTSAWANYLYGSAFIAGNYGGPVEGTCQPVLTMPGLHLTGLSGVDPHVAGEVWNNAGVLTLSAG